jgi:hypothetical protein
MRQRYSIFFLVTFSHLSIFFRKKKVDEKNMVSDREGRQQCCDELPNSVADKQYGMQTRQTETVKHNETRIR